MEDIIILNPLKPVRFSAGLYLKQILPHFQSADRSGFWRVELSDFFCKPRGKRRKRISLKCRRETKWKKTLDYKKLNGLIKVLGFEVCIHAHLGEYTWFWPFWVIFFVLATSSDPVNPQSVASAPTYQASIHYKCPSRRVKLKLSDRNWHCMATQLWARGFGSTYDCNELDFQSCSQQWGLFAKTFTSSHLLLLILTHLTPHLLC